MPLLPVKLHGKGGQKHPPFGGCLAFVAVLNLILGSVGVPPVHSVSIAHATTFISLNVSQAGVDLSFSEDCLN